MSQAVSIVVIDDNPGSLELLSAALAHTEAAVHTASTPAEGLALVRRIRPQLVVTDLVMPGMNGLQVLENVVAFDPYIDVILMTAHYTTETAVAAIRAGAADYLQKPVKIALLRERVSTLIEAARHRRKAAAPSQDSSHPMEFEGLVASSHIMWDLFGMIQRIAPHFRSVLVHGPTGAGKDLVAGALHRRSGVNGKFVVLNCSAVVETLFESELFGHVKGAFTGADRDKVGLFELANGGTLFLDEIGDMPLPTQAKLLRAIQNQEVLPVGSLTARKVNVRIVAATHRDLHAAIVAARFREDLFYRLSMVELTVPPLKDRPEDVPLLARHFVHKFSHDAPPSCLSATTGRAMCASWSTSSAAPACSAKAPLSTSTRCRNRWSTPLRKPTILSTPHPHSPTRSVALWRKPCAPPTAISPKPHAASASAAMPCATR
jgi:DNA-binding NtrC family response regulator